MNKIGFGFLRLPGSQAGDDCIDWPLLNRMVDMFLEKGGVYFDAAYTYLNGRSETAIREAVVKRHPREKFQIADKLPSWKVTSHRECYSYFEEQLDRCGVDFFDVYLLHWLNGENYRICQRNDEFAFLRKMKEAGKVKKIGFSYHDGPELLEEILNAHTEVDVVQLQINYLDWESEVIQAGKCYEVAAKHGKSIVVMEPVKGGALADIPAEAKSVLTGIHKDWSAASWAVRFAQSLERVDVVLSGMNAMEQLLDNMQDAPPLTQREREAIGQVGEIIRRQTAIPCTGCRYCAQDCPQNIPIWEYFRMYNEYRRYPQEDWKIQPMYDALAKNHGRASDCAKCKNCEKNCPQHLEITKCLEAVAEAFG